MVTDEAILTANDYSLYCDLNLTEKLKPVNNFVEVLLIRLEEFQILLEEVKRNQIGSSNISSLLSCTNEFDELCGKIDGVEALMEHVKDNLDKLEEDIDKAETNLGFGESSIKVSSLFTPLFKKPERKFKSIHQLNPLNTQDYFTSSFKTE